MTWQVILATIIGGVVCYVVGYTDGWRWADKKRRRR